MSWVRNQKLTDEQIATIKFLKSSGIQLSLIAQTLAETYGVSKSIAYYHCSDNRDSYDYQAKKIKEAQKQLVRERIHNLIENGYNTQQVAEEWNMPLAIVNKIYSR